VNLDQDLDVDSLELDGDVEVDPIVDIDLDPRSAVSRRAFLRPNRRSTCKVKDGVEVYVAVKVEVLGATSWSTSTSSETVPGLFSTHLQSASTQVGISSWWTAQ
jgi:hypothetical protein